LLAKSRFKFITIDIDSSVVNVEGHQEGAVTRRVLHERIQSKKAWEQLLQHPVCLL
jgi:limonene-1,2-epoxide hydrolase